MVRVYIALAEDLRSIPNTHVDMASSSCRTSTFFWPLWAVGMHTLHTHMYRQDKSLKSLIVTNLQLNKFDRNKFSAYSKFIFLCQMMAQSYRLSTWEAEAE